MQMRVSTFEGRSSVMWFSVGSGLAVMRVSSDMIQPSKRFCVIMSRRSVTGYMSVAGRRSPPVR
jgi:hypothetical protein